MTAEFVPPTKPDEIPKSLNYRDYGYFLPNGRFRFWPGFDASYKSMLMAVSRDASHPKSDWAMRELARRCWSNPQRERARQK